MSNANSVFFKLSSCLNECIQDVCANQSLFLVNPETNFSRKRSGLCFLTVFKAPFMFAHESIQPTMPELVLPLTDQSSIPGSSALTAARHKICPEAYRYIHRLFDKKTRSDCLYNGYRLLACDGSEAAVYGLGCSQHLRSKSKIGQQRLFIHLNTLSDVLENTIADTIIQPAEFRNEDEALLEKREEKLSGSAWLQIWIWMNFPQMI